MVPENLRPDMIALFDKTLSLKFHKKTYSSDIEELKRTERELMGRIAETCDESEDSLNEIADYLPQYVCDQLGQIASKRKREIPALDYNMNMVSYFVPLMGEIPSPRAKEFTQKMVEIWNEKMPAYKIGQSTVAGIESGFKNGLCYITTAVCRSQGRPDDCYELTLLRDYRDGYMMETESGSRIVKEYYNIAPTIVKRIDREQNSDEIYAQIWEHYLQPCVQLIEANRNEACKELYTDMVRRLEEKYLYS